MIPDELLDVQARLCQAMGNHARLKIVHTLREGEKNVSELVALTGYAEGLISRHLGILRHAGIVVAERRASHVVYRIANPKIMTVCDLMQEILAEQLRQRSRAFSAPINH
jgi:DNA-binding transcriptional ArsR family regulator